MPTLLDLQRSMRAGLAARDVRGIAAHVLADGIAAEERLDVYRNTSVSVLTRALRIAFPAVHRLVGEEFFCGAVRVFIEGHLPTSACLDLYGAEFPEFLGGFAPAAPVPYLADVARLERIVNSVMHADDVAPLDARRLAALSDADRARVRFARHPAVDLMRADFPADEIWRAVLEEDDAALARIDPDSGAVSLLVERTDSGVEVRRLAQAAWDLTARLFAGWPLHRLVGRDRRFDAELLAEHLARGRFAGYSVAAPDFNLQRTT